MARTTEMQRLKDKMYKELGRSDKPDHEGRMYALMGAFIKCQEKGPECENCNTVGVQLSEPISMPSGKVRRVCVMCLAELKLSTGRPVYTQR